VKPEAKKKGGFLGCGGGRGDDGGDDDDEEGFETNPDATNDIANLPKLDDAKNGGCSIF